MLKIIAFIILLVLCSQLPGRAQKYTTGKNDGFSLSEVSFTVGKITGAPEVCQGSDALFGVAVKGSSDYSCKWIKLENRAKVYPDTAVLLLPAVTAADNGHYFCEVADRRSGYKKYTDTVQLTVYPVPTIGLTASSLCIGRGASVVLTASGASNFQWSQGKTGAQVTETPQYTTVYTVKGYNVAVCPAEKKLTVEVLQMNFESLENKYISEGERVTLAVQTDAQSVNWYSVVSGVRTLVGSGKQIQVSPSSTTVYEVEASLSGVTRSARTTVFVKPAVAYTTGLNDGFSLSEVAFIIGKVSGSTNICHGSDAELSVAVQGSGTYQYLWKKLEEPSKTLSDSPQLKIPACTPGEAGHYFCKVTDRRSGYVLYSDTVMLNIFAVPVLTLTASPQRIAIGGSAVLKATGASHYHWMTGDITGQITVAPQETTIYRVQGYDVEECPVEKEITVDVVQLDLVTGPDVYVAKGESVRLSAITSQSSVEWYRYTGQPDVIEELEKEENWTLAGTQKNWNDVPLQTTIYKAVVELEGTKKESRQTVYVKEKNTYANLKNDGFGLSELSFTVGKLEGAREICKGSDLNLSFFLKGSSTYSFKWVKLRDRARTFPDTSVLVIKNCDYPDSSRYYCEVKDVRSGYVQYTDTVSVKVVGVPTLQLSVSALKIAEGGSSRLTASGAMHYKWSTGATDADLTVKPKVTTSYRLKGYDAEACPADTSVTIEVLPLQLSAGPDRYISEGESVNLFAETPIENIQWYKVSGNNREPAGTGKSITVSPGATSRYEAEAELLGLKGSAGVNVFVKPAVTFTNGLDDGFTLSELSFIVDDIAGPDKVCLGDEVALNVTVHGAGAYSYKWMKMEEPSLEFPADLTLNIKNCRYADAGRYYCLVTDIRSGYTLSSDTLTLQVFTTPTITTAAAPEKIAEGGNSVLTISGASNYRWMTGDTASQITVFPESTTTYTVKAYDAEACPVDTSVTVEVISLDLKVGPDRYISEGESLTLSAVTSLDPVIWYKYTGDLGNSAEWLKDENWEAIGTGKNMSVSPGVTTAYCAEVAYNGMKKRASLTVFVKASGSYTNGLNDGFAQSEVAFQLSKISGPTDVCLGTELVLNVAVKGTSGYLYRWVQMEQPLRTFDSLETLIVPNCVYADSGRYYCVITDIRSGYSVHTDTVKIRVLTVPDLELTASATRIGKGGSVVLTASGATHYLWTTGQTDAEITVSPEITTNYRVKGYHAEACPADSTVTIEVIDMHLDICPDRYISQGDTARLWAFAGTGPLKWFRYESGSWVAVGQGDKIGVSPDTTSVYKVEIELDGILSSATVTVYVNDAIAYTTDKNDGFCRSEVDFTVSPVEGLREVCQSGDANFSVSVSGCGAYFYRWYKIASGISELLKSGGDTEASLLTLENCQLKDTIGYYCEVTDMISGNIKYSDTVRLKVLLHPAAKIGSPADGTILCYGNRISLDARDTEFGNIYGDKYDYTWNGDGVIGRRDSAVVLVSPEKDERYILSVSNGACAGLDTVTIRVNKPYVDIPAQLIVGAGDRLEIKATTPAPVSLEWYIDNFNNLAQVSNSTIPFTYPVTSPVMVYVRTNDQGCPADDSCQVLVRSSYGYMTGVNDGFSQSCVRPVIVESSPAKIAGCTADSLVIDLVVEGTELQYIWQKEVNFDYTDFASVAGANVSGLGSSTLRFRPPLAEDEGVYRCVVKNECGEVISDTFAVSVGGRPVLRTKLNRDWDQCIHSGNAQMAIYATSVNDMPKTYKWYKDNVELTGSAYKGPGISVPLDDTSRRGLYKVVVSNECGSVADSTWLPVFIPAWISSVDSIVYACEEGNAEFQVKVSGGGDYKASLYRIEIDPDRPLGYTVKEQIGSGLKVTIPGVNSSYHNNRYVWIVSNLCGGDTSSIVRLSIDRKPEFIRTDGDKTLCSGDMLELACEARQGESALTYRWFKNGVFTGKTGPVYQKAGVNVGDAGNYICYARNAACAAQIASPVMKVTVNDVAAISLKGIYIEGNVQSTMNEYCQGVALSLKVDLVQPARVDSVRWTKDNRFLAAAPGRIDRTDSTVLRIDSLTAADEGWYNILIYNSCGTPVITPIHIKVLLPAHFEKDGGNLADMTLCDGDDQALTVKASGTTPIRYTWTHNGSIVADGYSNVIYLSGVTVDTSGTYCCEIHNGCAQPELACAKIHVSRPAVFVLEGGGSYCLNSNKGASVVLNGSDKTTVYHLYQNGVPVPGGVRDGKDVVPEGAPIVFDNCSAGTYYVTGVNERGCEFRMPGTVVIKGNTAPVAYPLTISQHFCNGSNGAVLKLGSSENNPDIIYKLWKEEAGGWQVVANQVAGTGTEILWDKIKEGSYKVTAENRVNGCSNVMDGIVTVERKELPQTYDLSARDQDTVYCANGTSSVQLYLSGSQTGVTYSLLKNRYDVVVSGSAVTWNNVTEGSYTVKAKNQWGCEREMGYRRVIAQAAPVVSLSGGAVFCSDDTIKHTLEISNLERNVKYIIYREFPEEQFGELDGVSGMVKIKVPSLAKNYYVKAIDKTPEACSSISSKVAIQESDFKIVSGGNVVIANGESARLSITVTGGVQPVVIKWSPADKIDGAADQASVNTIGLQSGQTFTVNVRDQGGCEKELPVEVIVTGDKLAAEIREADKITVAADTLKLCANERLDLYGAYDGGNGTYDVRWLENGNNVASGQWLRGYKKNGSGNIILEVTSASVKERDTVYVQLLDTARGIDIPQKGLQCVTEENYAIELPSTERNVIYTLEYDRTGGGLFDPVTGGVTGTGNAYSFLVNGMPDAAGYYRIKADRQTGSRTCHSYMSVVELREGVVPYIVSEDITYCEGQRKADSIRLSASQEGVTYQLYRKPSQLVATLSGNDAPLLFTGKYGDGIYKVSGTRGACQAWMEDSVTIKINRGPSDKLLVNAGSYCETDPMPVNIGVYNTDAGVVYTLFRNRLGVITEEAHKEGPGTISFGDFRNTGGYYVVAGLEPDGCERELTDRVLIGNSPAAFTVTGSREYPLGTAVPETTVKAYRAKAGVQYVLYQTDGAYIGQLGGLNRDTLYYTGRLAKGEYVVRAEAGSCMFQSEDTVKIRETVTLFEIVGDTLFCDTDQQAGVQIGISGTQTGVKYILQKRDKVSGNFADLVPAVTLTGSGSADGFAGLFKAGDYRIVAENGYRALMEGILHVKSGPLPDTSIVVDIVGNVCADSTVTIRIATEAGVEYTLYHNGALAGYTPITGNATTQSWVIPKAVEGTYRIKADNGECDMVFRQEIEAGTYPAVGILDGDTLLCSNVGGELFLDSYQPGVTYTLHKISGEEAGTGAANGLQYRFTGVFPGNYYARAAVGMCYHNSNTHLIKSIPAVEWPADFVLDYSACVENNSGWIKLDGLDDRQSYFIASASLADTIRLKNLSGNVQFPALPLGEYCMVAQEAGKSCQSTANCFTIREQAPADTLAGDLTYCEGEFSTRLSLSGYTTGAEYTIYTLEGVKIETLKSGTQFREDYAAGKYIFEKMRKGVFESCTVRDSFEIIKTPKPSGQIALETSGGTTLCAGLDYRVGLQSSEPGVTYILRKVEGSRATALDTLTGDGNAVRFRRSISQEGYYRIYAQHGGADCGLYLDSMLHINSQPQDIAFSGCSACGGSLVECAISVTAMERDICYILYTAGHVAKDTLYGPGSGAFKKQPTGSYYIMATDLNTDCRDTMSVHPAIENHPLPRLYAMVPACAPSAEVALGGSEGSGVEYILYRNKTVVDTLPGSGAMLSFGVQTIPGIYKVWAENDKGCGRWMQDSVTLYNRLGDCGLTQVGDYCAGSSVTLRHACSVPGWSYYLSRLGIHSDTLSGKLGGISWDTLNQRPLLTGNYQLYAYNNCKDTMLAEFRIVPAVTPQTQSIAGTGVFCGNDGFDIVLENSEINVQYRLVFLLSTGAEAPLANAVAGTGASLSVGGRYTTAGRYRVYGKFVGSTCEVQIAEKAFVPGTMPRPYRLTGQNICLSGENTGIELGMSQRDAGIAYYLQKIPDGETVDSLKSSDPAGAKFRIQSDIACYGAYAVHETSGCRLELEGSFCLGAPPVVHHVENPGDTVNLCVGETYCVWLDTSDLSVKYRLLKNGAPVGDEIWGTGGRLKIGCAGETGIYKVLAQNGCDAVMADSVIIKRNSLPVIAWETTFYRRCENGDSVTIALSSPTRTDVTYMLMNPGGAEIGTLPGSGSRLEFLPKQGEGGFYKIKATDINTGCFRMDSIELRIDTLPKPFITSLEPNEWICAGGSGIRIKLSGSERNANYTLWHGDRIWSTQSGTGSALTFSNINQPGRFKIVATYNDRQACSQDMFGLFTLRQANPIERFLLEGTKSTYCYNDPEKGSVRLQSSTIGIEYRLYKEGVALGNPRIGTGDTLCWTKLEGKPCEQCVNDKDGYSYYVEARDPLTGCTQRMNAVVKIMQQGDVKLQYFHPNKDIYVCQDSSADFTVVASGCNLNYRWYRKDKNGVTIDLGVNEPYYNIEKAAESHYGVYWCEITNACPRVAASSGIEVKIRKSMERKADPDVSICDAKTTVARLEAIYYGTSYRWYRMGKEDGEPIGMAQVLVLNDITSASSGKYICIASNECSTLRDTCELRVGLKPEVEIVKIPADSVFCRGEEYELSVRTTDSVMWYRNGIFTDSTGNRFYLPSVKPEDAGHYSARVIGGCDELSVNVANLYVDDTIRVLDITPENQILCEGRKLNLFIETSPSERVAYEWLYQGRTLSKMPKFEYGPLAASNTAYTFRVWYTNKCILTDKTDPSKPINYRDVRVTVAEKADVGDPVRTIVTCAQSGADTTLSISHSDFPGMTFEWYFFKGQKDTIVLPSKADTLSIALSTKNSGYYFCRVDNGCEITPTNSSWVRVDSVPVCSGALPDCDTLCEGGTLELNLAATGGSLNYDWMVKYKDGTIAPLDHSLQVDYESVGKLTLSPLTRAYDSCRIWCNLGNSCGVATSDTMLLRLYEHMDVQVEKPLYDICGDQKAQVIVSMTGGLKPWKYEYKEMKSGVVVSRSLQTMQDTLWIPSTGDYVITRVEDSLGCFRTTGLPEFKVIHREVPEVVIDGGGEVCMGSKVTLHVALKGGVGPWKVYIHRNSDGKLADDLAENPLVISADKLEADVILTAVQSETYYIEKVEDLQNGEGLCETVGTGQAIVKVNEKIPVRFTPIADNGVGQCENINLLTKLKPNIKGELIPEGEGAFYVDDRKLSGQWWQKERLTAGMHTIKYVYAGNSCAMTPEVDLRVDSLPFGEISLPAYVCDGGGAVDFELTLHGSVPLKIDMRKEWTEYGGNRKPVSDRTDISVTGTTYTENVHFLPEDSCIHYAVQRITDKYGCSSISPVLRDTILKARRPEMDVHVRCPNRDGVEWVLGLSTPYYLATGDSLGVKLTLTQGACPWVVNITDFPNNTFFTKVLNIHQRDTVISVKEAYTYLLTPDDRYCNNPWDEEYLTIQHLDTGYIRAKVLLEGPYTGANKMSSGIEDHLPRYGMADLPAAIKGRVIDWIELELRDGGGVAIDAAQMATGVSVVLRDTCLLLDDGTLVDRNGNATIALPHAYAKSGRTNSYHIALRHRNHLAVMTSSKWQLVGADQKASARNVDFTKEANIYFTGQLSNHMKRVGDTGGGVWAMCAGEVNTNALVSIRDPNIEAIKLGVASGYSPYDINFDGRVDWQGWNQDSSSRNVDWLIVIGNRNKFSEIKFIP